MTTPSITPAQAKADALLIIGVASALGLKLDGQTSTWLTIAVIAAATVAHFVSYLTDAKLRKARAENAFDIVESGIRQAKKDPVATAEQVEKIVATVFKAIDAQTTQGASNSVPGQSTRIPIVETPAQETPGV